jgi:hypothetical protein
MFCIADKRKWRLGKVQLIPEGMKPMAARSPKPERTFRILFTVLHAIETVCKVGALLSSYLEYSKETR